MPTVELTTSIAAPLTRVFDLARSVDLHAASTSHTGERAVGGVTSGLLDLGQQVTWRARHLGVWQCLTAEIIVCNSPFHFADRMLKGAFASMEHHHHFESTEQGTLMRDVFTFTSPLGPLGRLADFLFLTAYMRCFLRERNRILKGVAETEEWKRYLPPLI